MPAQFIAPLLTTFRGLLTANSINKLLTREKPTPELGKAPIRIKAGIQINASRMMRTINKAGDVKVGEIMLYGKKIITPLTPVDTGKARRNWSIQGKGIKQQLVNTVPYTQYLDACWGHRNAHSAGAGHSKQARRGLIKPTVKKIRRRFK